MAVSRSRFDSWAQARRQIAELVERVNADPDLARAAAANPLLALEALGYEIAPEARQEFADRIRFGEKDAADLAELRDEIFQHAGRRFDIDSPEELEEVLHSDLRIGAAHQKRSVERLDVDDLRVEPAFLAYTRDDRAGDPLERYEGAHPIIAPLLRYRRMEAQAPRLASRETFERVRRGEAKMPGLTVKFRVRGGKK